jgi:hypothetical protein
MVGLVLVLSEAVLVLGCFCYRRRLSVEKMGFTAEDAEDAEAIRVTTKNF